MRLLTAIGTAVLMLVLACGGLFGALAGEAATASCTGLPAATASRSAGGLTPPTGGYPPVGTWNREAVGNGAIIVGVGAYMGVPVRGWIIAVATAIQESSLINLPDLGDENNADSLGLFQQRPSQRWGTPAQIMDPAYASTKFFEHLLAVPGWQSMPLTEAAQAVQRSATPGAYAKHEAQASAIVAAAAITSLADPSVLAATCDPSNLQATPSGFTLPPDTPPAVTAAILWAFAQLGTPYSFGGDCTNAHDGDPAHQCDCSSLIILSSAVGRGCDLRSCVEDGVLDAAAVDTTGHCRGRTSSSRRDARPPGSIAGIRRAGRGVPACRGSR